MRKRTNDNIADIVDKQELTISFRDLLEKLTFLSKIRRGYKVNFKDYTLVESDSLTAPFWRWWNREGRDVTITKIKGLIARLQDYVRNSKNLAELKTLHKLIPDIQFGIKNLKITYSEDTLIKSKIDVCCASLDQIKSNTFQRISDLGGLIIEPDKEINQDTEIFRINSKIEELNRDKRRIKEFKGE